MIQQENQFSSIVSMHVESIEITVQCLDVATSLLYTVFKLYRHIFTAHVYRRGGNQFSHLNSDQTWKVLLATSQLQVFSK